MIKKLILPGWLLIFFLAANSFAQSPNAVLKKAEKALGGKKEWQKITSLSKKGLISRIADGAEGEIVQQIAAPNSFHELIDFDGFEIETGYNGKSGWRRDSREGLQTLTGAESRDFQTEADLRGNLWFNAKQSKAKITGGETVNINGKTAIVVRLAYPRGTVAKLFFDPGSDLLIREEISFGNATKIYDYEDYRPVGKIKIPFSVKMQNGAEIFLVKFNQIVPDEKIAASVFDFPRNSDAPLPDINALLLELQANEDRIENILDNYSFTEQNIQRQLGKDGILRETESETSQLSFYKGYRIKRLIAKNGKPLTAEEQKSEDREVQKRVEEIEKQIAKDERKSQQANGAPDENNRRISIAEVLRASLLTNPRRERLKGRDVIVFDFAPNPNFDMKNAKSILKFFGKTAGVMWIDEQDKQVARIEAVLADSFKIGGGVLAKLRQGASFTLEKERVNDEIWLPSVVDINLSVRALLIKNISVNQKVKYADYQKFNTEVKDAKVDELKEKP